MKTTLFSIQQSPEYARADSVLAGCQPLSLGDGMGLFSDCKGVRQLAKQLSLDRQPAARKLEGLEPRRAADDVL